jgi:hypothetical protein
MMHRKLITVYYRKHTKHTNATCGQNAEFLNVILDGVSE